VTASCPQGKVLVGTGYTITGGKSGVSPNAETDVVVNEIEPSPFGVSLEAIEEEPTSANWSVSAHAICARA